MPKLLGHPRRSMSYQPHDTAFDPGELAEARRWRETFQRGTLPKEVTTFSRSSGPGGQNVNKSACLRTSCGVGLPGLTRRVSGRSRKQQPHGLMSERSRVVPKLLHSGSASFKVLFHTERSVSACRLRHNAVGQPIPTKTTINFSRRFRGSRKEVVPGETMVETQQKYEAL